MDLQSTKLFLRVLHDDEDSLIIALISSAETYVKNNLKSYISEKVKDTKEKEKILKKVLDDKRTHILINMLVAHLYENRGMLVEKAVQNPIFTNFLWQIKGDLIGGEFGD